MTAWVCRTTTPPNNIFVKSVNPKTTKTCLLLLRGGKSLGKRLPERERLAQQKQRRLQRKEAARRGGNLGLEQAMYSIVTVKRRKLLRLKPLAGVQMVKSGSLKNLAAAQAHSRSVHDCRNGDILSNIIPGHQESPPDSSASRRSSRYEEWSACSRSEPQVRCDEHTIEASIEV